jgi:hypothetical protein
MSEPTANQRLLLIIATEISSSEARQRYLNVDGNKAGEGRRRAASICK